MIEFGDYTLIETTVLKYLFEHLVNVFRVQNTNNSFGIWQLSPRQRIAYKIVFCLFVFLKVLWHTFFFEVCLWNFLNFVM